MLVSACVMYLQRTGFTKKKNIQKVSVTFSSDPTSVPQFVGATGIWGVLDSVVPWLGGGGTSKRLNNNWTHFLFVIHQVSSYLFWITSDEYSVQLS